MSGPSIEICLDSPVNSGTLDALDAVLERNCDHIERTRKGRVWTLSMAGGQYHAAVEQDDQTVCVNAPTKSAECYTSLLTLARAICEAVGGIYANPEK